MTKIFYWTTRILFVAGVAGLIACGLFFAWFSAQRAEWLSALEIDSRVVPTAAGDVEVVTVGPPDAPAVLVLHGTPGGYDQALAIGQSFAGDGDLIVAPSRPGYLRTPLVDGFLFSEQADVMVALLDAFGIRDVSVVGLGAGAMVGAEMAVRHPGRVRGVVMISPPTVPLPAVVTGTFGGINYLGAQVMAGLGGDLGAFLWIREWASDPLKVAGRLVAMDTNSNNHGALAEFILNDPGQREMLQKIVESIYPLSPREAGARNDLLQLRHPQPTNFASINSPVLVLTGGNDHAREVVNPSHIVGIAPDANAEVIEGAGSLVWFGPGASAVPDMIREFLQNLPPPLPAD